VNLPPPTTRLRFREWRDDDAASVLEQFSDEQAKRFYGHVASPESAATWVRRMQERQAEDGHCFWVLESLDDARYLGDCGLLFQEVEGEPLLEIGYHLTAAERGQGFAGEAARACLDHAFEEMGAEIVGSLVHPDNGPSARVASRLHAEERRVTWRDETYRLFFTDRAGRPPAP